MRKAILAGALLVAAACSKDGGGGPLVVTTVSVMATPTQISVGGTAQASAIVKDQNGNPLTGKTVTWTTLQPAIATVNATTGLITGVSAGTATIQGTSAGVTGTATVIVIAAVSACNTGITLVDLPVGGVRVLSATETQGCIKMPATAGAPADYLVIPGNTSSTPDILGKYVLKSDEGDNVPSTTIAPSNAIFSAENTAPRNAVGDLGAAQITFETRLRLMERRELRIPDAQRAHRERLREAAQGRFSVSSAIPAVGDRLNFKVPGRTNACTNFTTITAEVTYVNDKAIIYNDVASPANGFTATDYQQIGDEFSNLIYPTDVSFFGTPLDDDKNGRVIVLYTAEVNKLTEANSNSFVGGFFFAGDLFPSTGAGSCAQSNQAELFYMLAPDPDGTINNNKRSLALVRQNTRGTIAHEFQHMINASERIRSPIVQPLEDVWLDEALSHFAEDATGRALRGISETEDATFSRVHGGSIEDYNAFFFQNFARFRIYLNNPGPVGPTSSAADTSLAARGAAWALLRYAADQYSGGDVKLFTRKLAGGPDVGVANLVKNAGATFDAIASGWMIANYADNVGIPGLSALYSYKVYNMRSQLTSITAGQYPLKVTTVSGSGFVLTGLEARSGSGNYFFAQQNSGSPARTWRFLNSDGATAASFTGAAWIILRVR
ncbi:MAG: Ig-like domain-containing protein [Gemmatimonadaceae bacterium]